LELETEYQFPNTPSALLANDNFFDCCFGQASSRSHKKGLTCQVGKNNIILISPTGSLLFAIGKFGEGFPHHQLSNCCGKFDEGFFHHQLSNPCRSAMPPTHINFAQLHHVHAQHDTIYNKSSSILMVQRWNSNLRSLTTGGLAKDCMARVSNNF